jgi:hypothetical protein
MVVHRWGEGDCSIREPVAASAGDELASHATEQHELSNVVEMAKAAELGRFGSDRHMFGKNCRSDRKLDGFTDWAKSH